MVSHLEKECSDNSAVTLKLSSLVKPFQKSLADSINQNQDHGAEDVPKDNYSMDVGK